MKITTIGLDIAKIFFHVVCFKVKNNALVNKPLFNQHKILSVKFSTSLFVMLVSVLDLLNC